MITLDPHAIAQRLDAEDRRPLADADHRLLARTALLPAADRLLVRLVFVDRLPVRRAADLLGLPAGTVSRRARRLYRRLHQPLATLLLSPRNDLPVELRQLAVGYFILRKRMNALAAETGKPIGQIRAAIDFIRGWWRAASVRRARE